MQRLMDNDGLPDPNWAEQYLEAVEDLVIVASAHTGTIHRTNAAAVMRLESINKALVGSYVVQLVHKDDRQQVADALAELTQATPDAHLTLRLNDPDTNTFSSFQVYLRLFHETGEILVVNREITELAQSQKRLAPFERFVELSDDIMVVTTLDGTIVEGNPAAARIHGVPIDSFPGKSITDFIHPNGFDTWNQIPEMLAAGDGRARFTIPGLRPDGSQILLECITIVDWERSLAYTFERDITEAEHQKRQLELADRFFTITSDLLVRIDDQHQILQCNRAFSDFTGLDVATLIGQNVRTFFTDNDRRLVKSLRKLREQAATDGLVSDEVVLHTGDGEEQQVFSVSMQRDIATESFFLAARDVTDERQLTAELRSLAETDAMTGLANRATFERQLQAELDAGRAVAVAFLDLDNFKKVNDSLGHATGDEMLKLVSKRLVSCVRANDVVARFGGDEFCVMLTNLGSNQSVDLLARVIREVINDPMIIDGRRLVTSCSVGIALSTPDIRQASELMKRGDAAAYTAKGDGRDRAVVFDEVLNDLLTNRFELEEELRSALASEQLDLDVQGIFCRDLHLAGVEALLRWDHPTRGRLGPEEFLGIAEDAGLMPAISDRVLTRAFESVSPWLRANEWASLSVNLSPGQLANPVLRDRLCEVASFYGTNPGQIFLEITEDALVESVERTGTTLHKLRSDGFRLAMDDFGKGASSLGHLRDFPFDVVKIDKGFIESIESDSVNTAIVESVIGLARRLDMWVVAEGIESQEHVDALVHLGCDRLQGFHLHRPEPVGTAAILNLEGQTRHGA